MENTLRGVLKAKAGTGQAVKIGDDWYEMHNDKVKEFVGKIQKPYPEVEITYVKEGYKKVISFLKVVGKSEAKESVATGSTSKPEYTPSQPKNVGTVTEKPVSTKQDNAYWDKKDKAIKRGNALNAAAASLSGYFTKEDSVEVITETVKAVAQTLVEWLEVEE